MIDPDHNYASKYVDRCSRYISKERWEAKKMALDKVLFESGKKAYNAKDFDEALAKFEKAVAVDPENAEAKRYAARASRVLNEQQKKLMIFGKELCRPINLDLFQMRNISCSRFW